MGRGGSTGFSVTDYNVLASTYGVVGDGTTDNTSAMQAFLNAAEGKRGLVNISGTILTGKVSPKSNSTIAISSSCTLKKKLNGISVIGIAESENITILGGNGAKVLGDDLPGTSAFSSTIIVTGSKRIKFQDLHVDGSSAGNAGKDCYYIGTGVAGQKCEDILIVGGSAKNAKRNNVSVVGSLRGALRNIELSGATGAPGAGVGIEANFYDDVDQTLIDNCHIHHNEHGGVVQVFASNSKIVGGSVHDNGTYGVGTGSGGTQFDDGVYRPNVDIFGVTGTDNANGVVLVGDRTNLPVGMVMNFHLRNGATKPAELSASYFIVSRHVGSNGIVLGQAVDYMEITSFSTGFTGTQSGDPAVSDVRIQALADGQSDGIELDGVTIYNNGAQGIFMAGSGGLYAHGCKVYDNGSNQVQTAYTRNVRVIGNEIYQTGASSANYSGIAFGTGSGVMEITGNNIHDTRGKGINGASWTGANIDGNTVNNCGEFEPSSGKAGVNLESIKGFSVTNNRVMQDGDNVTTLFGIMATGTAIDGTVTGNDCTGAGTTNANSISVSSGTNAVSNNKRRDGTLVP